MSRVTLSRLFPLLIALAAARPAPASAQTPPGAPPAWMIGLHAGAGNLSMEGDSLERDFGTLTQLTLGHVVAPGVVAGLRFRGWGATESGLTRRLQIFTVTAASYPAGRGFYLRGGIGVCSVKQQFYAPDTLGVPSVKVTHEDGGFAATAAVGFEFRLRRALDAGIDVEYARVVAAHVGGDLVSYTAGLIWLW